MPTRIEIPSAWQTVDPKTRDDLRRIRVVLEQLELAMRELGTPSGSTYEHGGSEELDLTGMSGLLATPQTPTAHKTSHQAGGTDQLSIDGLSGRAQNAQKVDVAGSGTLISTRSRINFIPGTNVALTITDDAPNDRANVTVASAALPGRIVARVHLGSAANTTAAGYQKVPLNTVTYDASGIWVAGSLAFRPTAAGTYHVSLRARVASAALSAAAIGKNGAPVIAVGYEGGNQVAVGGGGLVQVNGTTDTIDAWVACASVVAYTASGNDTYMDISGPFGP